MDKDEKDEKDSGAAEEETSESKEKSLDARLKAVETVQVRLARAEKARVDATKNLSIENARLKAQIALLRKKQSAPEDSERAKEPKEDDDGAEIDTHESSEGVGVPSDDTTKGAKVPYVGKARGGLDLNAVFKSDEFRKAVESMTPLPPGYSQVGGERTDPYDLARLVIRAERERHGQYGGLSTEDMKNTYHIIHRAFGMYPEEGDVGAILQAVNN